MYQDEVNKEWAYLYTAIYDGQPLHMLQEEVEALRWIQVDELRRYLSHHPDRFTPVAVKGISLILEHHFPV